MQIWLQNLDCFSKKQVMKMNKFFSSIYSNFLAIYNHLFATTYRIFLSNVTKFISFSSFNIHIALLMFFSSLIN